jgi:hypothetical protein
MHLAGFPGDRCKETVASFLTSIMFDHPWVDDRMPSLGYEDASGKLIGCLGVMPRPMVMNGRPVTAAISNNFIVDPEGQPGIAAFALMRSLRSAGADLILGEANAKARDICERLGWVTVTERSQRWLHVLRPAALGVGLLEKGRLPSTATRVLQGACRVPDTLLATVPGSPFRIQAPAHEDAAVDGHRLLELHARMGRHFSLRPCYDEASLTWLLGTLQRTSREQTLRGGIVPDEEGEPAGWYLYYSRSGGIGRVLQLGSEEGHHGLVLRHLFHDAATHGNHGVTGQSDPAWADALEEAYCFSREGSSWLIAHAPDDTLRQALSSRDAFVTRLETEAWITFAF